MTTLPAKPDDFAQRIANMRRLLVGIMRNLDQLEADIESRRSEVKPDGEQAAEAARTVVYRMGPQETKIIR